MSPDLILYIIIFLYGIVIGSFLNVCIYRIPKQESIVRVRSHCMDCGYQLRWYDLVPLFSYIVLRGRCRECGAKLSVQYPIVEAANGLLYCFTFYVLGFTVYGGLVCLLVSALVALSVIDFRTFEIPIGFNVFILTLGLIHLALDYQNWLQYVIGLVAVSGFLYVIYLATKGRGIGGGDIKLMAACGLFLGWKLIVLALVLGCVIGAVIHVARMRIAKADRVLAMGPYLSVGVLIAALWGERILSWYIGFYV